MAEPKIVEEKTFEYGVVMSASGNILHDALRQDDPAIRRRYDDGLYDIVSQKTGRLIHPRYSPETDYPTPKCQHCGQDPWND